MPDVSVGIYSIRVYDSKMNEEIFVEDNSYSLSLSQLIKDYFKTMKSKGRIYNKSQSLVMIDELLENNDKYISGVMKTGEYGYEEEFYEVSSNENTKEDTEGGYSYRTRITKKIC